MKKIGDKIEFKANSTIKSEIKEISLNDFKDKTIVLYFYPRDMTPGCTFQAENLRDNFKELEKENIIVIGVSPDTIKKHLNFIEKKELPFYLISDEDKELCNYFGIWQLKKFMGKEYMGVVRTTFIINKNKIISHIIEKPKVKDHAKEILDFINNK
jgi:peroxiredoxin Q/BCP